MNLSNSHSEQRARPPARPAGDMRVAETTPMRTFSPARAALMLAMPLLLAACASQAPAPPTAPPSPKASPSASASASSPGLADAAKRIDSTDPSAERFRVFKGSGVVVKGQAPGGGLPPSGTPATLGVGGGGVVLNFEGADLREVVRNILGDILNEPYIIDASIGGQVTIRTSAGLPREALPATLETLLRMNGATMVKEDGLWKIVPTANAVRGNVTPQLGNSQRALPPGFSVQIVPLRHVGAREMVRLLEPFAKDAAAVRADEIRNLLILSGTERELRHLMETIDMFDIDWMAGMSAGVFTLQGADVKTVMGELDKVFGAAAQSPLSGLLRIVPIERMNALLVISPNPTYLEEAKKWIERLDKGDASGGLRFYVYHLQNQRAEKLAPLLQQAITGRAPPASAPAAPTLAPGTPPGTIVNPPQFQAQPGQSTPATPTVVVQPQATAQQSRAGTSGDGIGIARNVQIVADKDNNTIIVVASGGRVPGARVGAEEARRAAAPGDDRGRDRRGVPARSVRVRRRVVFHQRQGPGRRALPPRHQPGQHLRPERRDDRHRRHRSAGAGILVPAAEPRRARRHPGGGHAARESTATPRSSPTRTSRPSTTRRRRSRSATRFRSTSRPSSAAAWAARRTR